MQYKPHDYQKTAIQFILDNPSCGVFAGVGRGKSSITLTVVEKLLADYKETFLLGLLCNLYDIDLLKTEIFEKYLI